MDSSVWVAKKQWMLISGLVLFTLVIAWTVIWILDDTPIKKTTVKKETKIINAGERLNYESLWRSKIEDEQEKVISKINELENLFKKQAEKHTVEINELKETKQIDKNSNADGVGGILDTMLPINILKNNEITEEVKPNIKKISINLPSIATTKSRIKTIIDTIPSGAFAEAVLLSGVDASSAMTAASNPRPLLLRLVDPGTLPRRFKSDLEDCHCTASCYGDISSERVHARLEKLTCIERLTGEIVETEVAGYIAGSDGREGIRGIVVSKDGQYLSRGFMSGIFSGFAAIGSPRNRQGMINPFSAGNPKIDSPSAKDLFQSGFMEGGSNALDRLSQYYIQRAEALQPVIQVAAGQKVDIVFTQGAVIGDTQIKQAISTSREQARAKLIQNEINKENPAVALKGLYNGENYE